MTRRLSVLPPQARAVYRLEVVAKDGGVPPRQAAHPITINVLDLNDNSPTFATSSLTFSIQENSPIGFKVRGELARKPWLGEVVEILKQLKPVASACRLL